MFGDQWPLTKLQCNEGQTKLENRHYFGCMVIARRLRSSPKTLSRGPFILDFRLLLYNCFMQMHRKSVNTLCFYIKKNDFLISGSDDGRVVFWKVERKGDTVNARSVLFCMLLKKTSFSKIKVIMNLILKYLILKYSYDDLLNRCLNELLIGGQVTDVVCLPVIAGDGKLSIAVAQWNSVGIKYIKTIVVDICDGTAISTNDVGDWQVKC